MNDRTNEEWLTDLRGSNSDKAISDLRDILVRGLFASLSNRMREDISILVEDFAQEALIKILDNLDTFRGESKFTTWAQKIAVHVAYTELRRRRWKNISLQEMIEQYDGHFTPAILTDPEATPEDKTTQHSMLEFVQRIIEEELTDRQRKAVTAVMIGGMPIAEVAQRMDTNRNALYKLIYDARQRLKRSILAHGFTPEDILEVFEK